MITTHDMDSSIPTNAKSVEIDALDTEESILTGYFLMDKKLVKGDDVYFTHRKWVNSHVLVKGRVLFNKFGIVVVRPHIVDELLFFNERHFNTKMHRRNNIFETIEHFNDWDSEGLYTVYNPYKENLHDNIN
ncbi:hypothetical protein [Kurthia sp. Dielmo]|uniref:hypothetical protein n=1 Tax=Kurthia sp. Dielmo TaxID=1033738 RepID=UPI0011219EEF|nr:hypothetical protein [Kurthia sp. Dielmo]